MKASSGGLGLGAILTVVFLGFKLAGIIDWSWFWVFSPLIFSVGIAMLLLIVIAIILSKS
jgi:hypothetical protein